MQTTMENCSSEFSIRNERSVFSSIRNRYGRRKREFRRKMNVRSKRAMASQFFGRDFSDVRQKERGSRKIPELIASLCKLSYQRKQKTERRRKIFNVHSINLNYRRNGARQTSQWMKRIADHEKEGVRLKHCDQNES